MPACNVVSPCARVFSGSLASRPAYRICGLMVADEALKPTARLPLWSMAALPIQRQVLSGW